MTAREIGATIGLVKDVKKASSNAIKYKENVISMCDTLTPKLIEDIVNEYDESLSQSLVSHQSECGTMYVI